MIALVLLPGMDGTGKLLAEFVSCLGSEIEPIIVSYPKTEALGYAELEEFAKAYLPNDRPFILLGESFSGPVAISLAASKPSGLVGLVLCCTFARNPTPMLRFVKNFISLLPFTPSLAGVFSPVLFGSLSSTKLRKALEQVLRGLATTTLRRRLRAVLEVDVSAQLKDLSLPILYLQATMDKIIAPSVLTYMQTLSPEMKVEKLVGPHLLLQTKPTECAMAVKVFVSEMLTNFNPSTDLPHS
jgi:pimeloyl-[acyl-carrier protein] methyl ester esterase